MSTSEDNRFCNSSFWDSALSWNTEDPDLTLCFEKTALVWGPCLFLWLLSPVELCCILRSKCRDIPWRFINITKLLLILVLLALSVVSLVWAVVLSAQGQKVFPVDLWTPALETLTFILVAVLMVWNKLRGRHTSGVLFLFWLLLSIAGVAQFRTEIRGGNSVSPEEPRYKFVLYMIHYPVVVVMLILNLFADPPPRDTNYPQTKKMCPYTIASFASLAVFGWFDQLIYRGFKKSLTVADLWDVRYQDTSAHIVPRFERHWNKHLKDEAELAQLNGKSTSNGTPSKQSARTKKPKKPASIVSSIVKTFWPTIVTSGGAKLVGDALSFVNPQILYLMIEFVAGKEYMWRGFVYAAGLFLAAETVTIFYHQNLMMMYANGLNWRTAIMSTIYKKALRISNSARKTSTVGEIVNLMAVDAQRIGDFAPYFHILWTSPIIIIVALVFLWQQLGPATLAGLVVMVVIIPINTVIANRVKQLQMKQMKFKDERVKLMNEVLCGIKVLKLYAWEPSFQDQILRIRDKELSMLRTAAFWNASTSFIWLCSLFLCSFASFTTFVLLDARNILTSEIAFVATALFNVMRVPIALFPMMIQMLVQSIVSVRRINRFLGAEELDLNSVSHDESRKEPLIIEDGTFSWGTEAGDTPVLRNINLKVKAGSLVAVVGAVGSGKSSLISAFLGEMDKISGYINTKDQIAYVPQQAWIQNATVRENIVFGSSFDSKRYHRAVEACALKPDFEMLPGGDGTEIGEKGINLSGGQKQRVSLARAVYNNADTYLLDDPLSAVDSHVGKHIFENVIGPTGVLSRKTRILVTHGVTFLPQVDCIVVMKGGEISEMGSFKELLERKGEFSEFLVQHITDTEEADLDTAIEELIEEHPDLKHEIQRKLSKSGSVRSTSSNRKMSVDSSNSVQPPTLGSQIDKLIQTEKTETGSVKWGVYGQYVKSVGPLLVILVVTFQLLYQAFSIAANIWLSDWTSDSSASVNGVQVISIRNHYLEFYTIFGVCQIAAVILSAFFLAYGTVLASRYLHFSMLTNILRCPMSFFDTTPTGRLVNRFGKDVDVVDNTLPFSISNALSSFGSVIGTLVVIIYSTPIFAAVIIPLGFLYYFVQKVYVTTSRQIKRIESVSRSPIYSHFSETISGAPSIRAYGAVNRFIKTLEQRVDANQMCLYPSLVSNRWLGIRLETVGNLLIFFAALFVVLGRDTLDAGIVGLSISYALQITGMMNAAVRMSSDVETNIVSVERIKEYANVAQEAAWQVQPRPDPKWPDNGTVKFEDYQVRYRDGLELVLKGVSFTVNGGEKIGIVGRTGAGKSSLTLCLFRILEAAGGCIYIDGLDISKIGLGDLRSKLTIIPQDPVLFSGTLRLNLDPFNAYSDSDIWRALQLAHLSEFTRTLPAGLQHVITEGGENLSVGQRQLICLARALLRKTQLLILDEATAAIDLETDDLIQQTIRREFRDCTVLTIAHRLNTIMDSDRVLVLDKGMIKEFDSPPNLLKDEASTFHGMARDAGLL